MKLDDIDISKIDLRLTELKKKIDGLRELEKEKKELEEIREVVADFNELQSWEKKPLFSQQKAKLLSFMRQYPFLCLYKRHDGILREVSAYEDAKSLNLYAKLQEDDLKSGTWAIKIKKLLSSFFKDRKSKSPEAEKK